MKKMISILCLITLNISCAQGASQLRYDQAERPVCYKGSPESAKSELESLDFDPALSSVRTFAGQRDGAILIYAEQIDENGSLQDTFVLPPCR